MTWRADAGCSPAAGYELVQVVPRTWTHLIAEAAGQPINSATPTPLTWREYVAHRTGLAAPEQMTDGAPATFVPFEAGYEPAEPADRAIMATRNAVFPRARADAALTAICFGCGSSGGTG
jgi:acetoin utilization protein AcuC